MGKLTDFILCPFNFLKKSAESENRIEKKDVEEPKINIEPKVPVHETIIEKPEYIEIDHDMTEIITKTLKPIIRDLNSYEPYLSFCKNHDNYKTLKTYKKVSEDSKTLTITLTQNGNFNYLMKDLIDSKITNIFKEVIETLKPMKFEVTSKDGNIYIKRMK